MKEEQEQRFLQPTVHLRYHSKTSPYFISNSFYVSRSETQRFSDSSWSHRFRSGRAVLKHELPSTKHRWTALLSRIHMNTSKYKRDRRQFQIHLFKNNKSCSIQFHLYFSISSLSVVTTCTYRAILCNVVSWKQIYLCNTDTNICK